MPSGNDANRDKPPRFRLTKTSQANCYGALQGAPRFIAPRPAMRILGSDNINTPFPTELQQAPQELRWDLVAPEIWPRNQARVLRLGITGLPAQPITLMKLQVAEQNYHCAGFNTFK